MKLKSTRTKFDLQKTTAGRLKQPAGFLQASAFLMAFIVLNLLNLQNNFAQSQNFTADGTFNVPAGVKSVEVRAWGGGGAGGGTTNASRSTGGGGAGGSYTHATNVPVVSGVGVPVTVGAGGTGVSNADGNPGGTSSFGALVTAAGGQGGLRNTGTTNATLNGAGAPVTVGVTYNGGAGGTGNATTTVNGTSGGGGGGAGSAGNGGNANVGTAGAGGTPDGGIGAAGTATSGNGTAATQLGGGGSGGRNSNFGPANRTGGNGFGGQVTVLWTTITSDGAVAAVTYSGTAQTTTLAYTASVGTPVSYSIDWDGIEDQGPTAFAFAGGGGTINNVSIPAGAPAGTYTGTMAVTNASQSSFELEVTVTIDKKELTVTGASADNKVYDGTTDATISGAALVGVEGEDDVALDALVGAFADKNVGEDIAVAAALTIAGDDIANYTLTQPAGLAADITAAELTVTDAVADNKVYDGNTDATISGALLNGVVDGEDVALDALVGTFADKNVGEEIAVGAALTIAGDDIANYTLTQPAGLAADITAAELTVSDAVADNKVYDGNTDATISGAVLNGVVDGEDVALDALVGTFAGKNVGEDIAVTAALTIAGDDIANYTLTQPEDLAADITAAELTVSDAVADNKVYDGNTDATISGAVLNGVVDGEDVALDALVGAFAGKNVGEDIAVTAALTIAGDDIANYTLTQPTSLAADITAKELIVTAKDAIRRFGDPNPVFELEYAGFIEGEDEDDLITKPGATTLANEASAPDDYDITVSGGESVNYSFTYVNGTLTVTSIVGIAPREAGTEVKIYPNPVAAEMYINRGELPEHTKAVLFDANGRQVMTISLDGAPVEMSHLRSGIYFLRIEGKSFRIVKE